MNYEEFLDPDTLALARTRRGRKAPGPVIDARVEIVSDLQALGMPREEIVRYCAQNFGIASRMATEYLKRGRELILARREEHRADALDRHLRLRGRLLELALSGGEDGEADLNLALRIADSMAKIEGLGSSVVKHEHEGRVDHAHDHALRVEGQDQLPDEEHRERLLAVLDQEREAEAIPAVVEGTATALEESSEPTADARADNPRVLAPIIPEYSRR